MTSLIPGTSEITTSLKLKKVDGNSLRITFKVAAFINLLSHFLFSLSSKGLLPLDYRFMVKHPIIVTGHDLPQQPFIASVR